MINSSAHGISHYLVVCTLNASVTFAAAAVGSKISTANINYRAAAGFPRSPTVAVTYVRVAARRILNLWRQKTCGCRTAFEVMSARSP